MESLVDEVRNWNSPVIGAYQLWNFTVGFVSHHSTGDAPVALLHFMAYPLLTTDHFLLSVNNRRKSLQSYVRGFEQKKEIDLLVSLQERIKKKRSVTISAIDIAIKSGLIVWDKDSAKIYPRIHEYGNIKRGLINEMHMKNGEKAQILGKWFSQISVSSAAQYLKVVL